MSRTQKSVEAESKQVDSEKSVESEEEVSEEEVEYEEVEEEEEEEEVEEEEEDEEVEEEVEEEEDDEENKKHRELLALPPHGSEVYLGGIPQNVSEKELRAFCKSIGDVTEIRIMKGKDIGDNKGYAFVTFRNKELASKAIEELNKSELKGKRVKCSTTQAKHRLFIGNIPKSWVEEDLKKVVTETGPGVVSVDLMKDPQNSNRNRGFAFVEYYNHACAEYSKQKMSNPKFKLDTNAATVSWADPRSSESSTSSQIKSVYVKNLPKDITQDQLRAVFEHHGNITKVALPPAKPGQENSRFGFIHFDDRSSAMKAIQDTQKYEIDGQVLDCSLAKPQADQKSTGVSNSQMPAPILPTYPPQLGFGMLGSPYGALGTGYSAAGFAQPLIYGGGPTTAGMAMMPMLLADGRIGYVLQQPGLQPHLPVPQHQPLQPPSSQERSSSKSNSRGGSSGGGGRRGNDSNRGRNRYNPY